MTLPLRGRRAIDALFLITAVGCASEVKRPSGATEVESYIRLVHRTYEQSLAAAEVLQDAVERFLRGPTADGLDECRRKWLAAREPYGWSEAFRFSEGPIDIANLEAGREGPEERLNGWPVNEAFIDSVRNDPRAGIIHDPRFDIDEVLVRERNAVDDESAILCGFHAIEFLLWGQDFDPKGPGRRSHEDFLRGELFRVRRAMYLRAVTRVLVQDLRWLAGEWDPRSTANYAARFRALDKREALRRMLTGVATLAGFELASERIAVPLESRSQEDEQSCFSDSTHRDLLYNVQGLDRVYRELDGLAVQVDAALAERLRVALADAMKTAGQIAPPFDQIVLADDSSPNRVVVRLLEKRLREIAGLLQEFGAALGVRVVVTAQ